MADLERGQRIKARREELHLTQPAVVELLEQAALELPEEHPLHLRKAGKPPVTLRGLQTWESGGGIAWEKAKLLAQVLQTDVARLINDAPVETPDPFQARGSDLQEMLSEIYDALRNIDDRLTRIEGVVIQVDPVAQMQAAAEELAATVERLRARPEPEEAPAGTSTRAAGKASRRAARSASR